MLVDQGRGAGLEPAAIIPPPSPAGSTPDDPLGQFLPEGANPLRFAPGAVGVCATHITVPLKNMGNSAEEQVDTGASGDGREATAAASRPPAATAPLVAALLPIMAAVFIVYLVIGLALPVLPLHVHQGLGLGTLVVGLVAGAQYAATLVSRLGSGHYADSRGAKRAVVASLLVAAIAGFLYLLSLRFASAPVTSVTILLVGRAVLGVAESLITVGALTWGLAVAGPQNAGKVMAWVGMAMYVAYAAGAPAGTALHTAYGFG